MSTQEQYLTINDLCELLSVTPKTVTSWRYRGVGPASFKAGKHVRYKRSDIDTWIEQNKCTPKNQKNEEDLDSKYEQEYADRYLLDTGAMFEADIFSGEGNFIATKELEECNNLLKLDIVNDWLGILSRYYDGTREDWIQEMEEQQND
tara:strand:+ start:4419 stop:4862 length:444 start_codon:yes stop_codon:yes gene_type:complete